LVLRCEREIFVLSADQLLLLLELGLRFAQLVLRLDHVEFCLELGFEFVLETRERRSEFLNCGLLRLDALSILGKLLLEEKCVLETLLLNDFAHLLEDRLVLLNERGLVKAKVLVVQNEALVLLLDLGHHLHTKRLDFLLKVHHLLLSAELGGRLFGTCGRLEASDQISDRLFFSFLLGRLLIRLLEMKETLFTIGGLGFIAVGIGLRVREQDQIAWVLGTLLRERRLRH
jgi:hypothetical protein